MPVVFLARSLEEAQRIERAQERGGVKEWGLRLFVRLWVPGMNMLLWCLERLLFSGLPRTPDEVRHVVVYTVGTLGDNVLLLPAVAALRRAYSSARLTVVTNCDGFGDYGARVIWGRSSLVDELVVLSTHPVRREGRRLVAQRCAQASGCDLFVNLSPFGNRGWLGAVVREMLFARFVRARSATGFRMATYKRKDHFHRVEHRFRRNEVRSSRAVLARLGISPVESRNLLPEDPEAKVRVRRIVENHAKAGQFIAVLNPGAKLRASYWPARRFGKLARRLADALDACVFINGTADEKGTCHLVAATARGAAVDLAGELSVEELIELLRLSSLCVTNNTGPMTLTAMLDVPTVVLCSTRFSPTFYMPVSDRSYWLFSFAENSYSYDDEVETAPDLLNIAVDDVLRAVDELLNDCK